jgi:hypothetical protein
MKDKPVFGPNPLRISLREFNIDADIVFDVMNIGRLVRPSMDQSCSRQSSDFTLGSTREASQMPTSEAADATETEKDSEN